MDNTESANEISIDGSYVEFGFEFYITLWAGYAYSSVFWTAEDSAREKVNDISIVMDGALLNASINIKVNGKEVVNVGRCGSHYQHNWEQDDKIRVKIWKTGAYSNNCTRFYARKSDTAFWDCLLDATNGDHEFYLDRSKGYVEFGFEFDVMGSFGEWQYSGVFWTAEDSAREKVWDIYIEMYGVSSTVGRFISVNCKTLVYGLSDGEIYGNHYFKKENKIRVRIEKTGFYSNNHTRLYARKAGDTKWDILFDGANGDHEFYIDESKGYAEFGFEFDITWGTDWPYSDVFWTAADSEREKVEDIYIYMGGYSTSATIDIYVNDEEVVSEGNFSSHEERKWDLNDIKVTVSHSGTYTRTTQELFARTLTGEEVVLNGRTGSYTMLVSPTAYVDIGYKFGVNTYTTLPYNDYFWFGKDHPNDTVEEITIHTSGTYWITNPCIEITVSHYYNDDLKI